MQRRDNRYILKMELRGWRKKRKITEKVHGCGDRGHADAEEEEEETVNINFK